MRTHVGAVVVAGLVGALLASCATQESQTPAQEAAEMPGAVAEMSPASGSTVSGTVTFTPEAGGVRIRAHLTGLTPGEHGFHIHEVGDCSAPDATSAGGHYNPEGMEHAGPDAAKRHVGDLGNISADADGHAHYDRLDMHLSLEGAHSIVGKSVIVHENVDDFTTQPTGNAGARVACGVILPR